MGIMGRRRTRDHVVGALRSGGTSRLRRRLRCFLRLLLLLLTGALVEDRVIHRPRLQHIALAFDLDGSHVQLYSLVPEPLDQVLGVVN